MTIHHVRAEETKKPRKASVAEVIANDRFIRQHIEQRQTKEQTDWTNAQIESLTQYFPEDIARVAVSHSRYAYSARRRALQIAELLSELQG